MTIRNTTHGAILTTAAAAALLAIAFGHRTVLGLFLGSINTATGIGFAAVSLALAISQIASGLFQPVCGAIADRWGIARVARTGGVLLAVATVALPFAVDLITLTLGLCLVAVAAGAVGSTPALIAAVNSRLPVSQRGLAAGAVGAGGSIGQLVMAPITQTAITIAGFSAALIGLGVLSLAALPLANILCRQRAGMAGSGETPAVATGVSARLAMRDWRYWAIAVGFLVCGFHVSFLLAHMPGMIADCGYSAGLAGVWLSVLGLANVAGSVGTGLAIQRFDAGRVLAVIYAARACGVAIFLLAPDMSLLLFAFAVWMGASYMATVPPTSALLARFYGNRHLGALFGGVMLVHQIGSFLGVWLGGIVRERHGSFDSVWSLDIALAVIAVGVNLAVIRGRSVPIEVRLAAPARA